MRALAHLCVYLESKYTLHIRQEENPLHVEGRDTLAYSGGPGHILILMGVFLIPAFRLCISGLSYQRVIGLIGCGPGIMNYGSLPFII